MQLTVPAAWRSGPCSGTQSRVFGYDRRMTPQIELDDRPTRQPRGSVVRSRPAAGRDRRDRPLLADPDWHRRGRDALLLFVSDEPAIGERFRYHGSTWEIVDYRDGWVARLVVA